MSKPKTIAMIAYPDGPEVDPRVSVSASAPLAGAVAG